MSATAIERAKTTKGWLTCAVVVLLVALSLANGAGNYLENRPVFTEQGVTWPAVWGQSVLLYAYLFLPIVIGVRAAMMVRVENDDHNWRRMASYDAALVPVYRGKVGALVRFCAAAQLIHVVLFLVTGLLLGFDPAPVTLARFLLWALAGWVGACAVALAQLYAALRIASFASAVTVAVVGAVAGFLITIPVPAAAYVFPYTQIGVGMRARALESFTGGQAALFLLVNLVLITGFAWAGARVVRRWEY
ncbi:ABC transporter permease [Halostreptopolyspora alba]|uniref:ABC transporter permease n=1 Tax=Halostreptopolyspora alba TaxID=2487137 RepID=A0A3N0E2Z8_9ACTN|nr:hypothetical protein EFW17_20110 [Nocardiopsaceae bacterium YIM 96095]